MRNILITGGTGFLGSSLTKALIARGDRLIILSRKHHQDTADLQYVRTLDDIASTTAIDACVNLAGEPLFNGPWTASKKHRIWHSRLDTTQSLTELNARLLQPMGVILSGSASGYYGDKGQTEVSESASVGDHFGAQLCDAWEASALKNSDLGSRVLLLRTGIVLGRGGALKPMIPTFSLGLGAVIGSGNQCWPWIGIDDWVRAVLFCLDHPDLSGPVNLCAPQAVSQKTLSAHLARQLRRPLWLPAIPAGLMRVLSRSSSDLLTDSVDMKPRVLMDAGFQWTILDCEEAIAAAVR